MSSFPEARQHSPGGSCSSGFLPSSSASSAELSKETIKPSPEGTKTSFFGTTLYSPKRGLVPKEDSFHQSNYPSTITNPIIHCQESGSSESSERPPFQAPAFRRRLTWAEFLEQEKIRREKIQEEKILQVRNVKFVFFGRMSFSGEVFCRRFFCTL